MLIASRLVNVFTVILHSLTGEMETDTKAVDVYQLLLHLYFMFFLQLDI